MYHSGVRLNLSDFDNEYSLNIFTDASIQSRGDHYDGCYGACAIYKDNVFDEDYRVLSGTTNNDSEIKAVRAGVNLALKHRNNFRVLNLFSDSQLCIFGVRDRFLSWTADENGVLYTKSMTPVSSQDIYLDIAYTLVNYNLRINFFHQKGHVNNHIASLQQAQHVFTASNRIRGVVDMNLIRYISKWNNIVDQQSRHILVSTNKNRPKAPEAITFELDPMFDRTTYYKLTNT